MSFILDALKKSEAERQRQAGPTLLELRITHPRRRYPAWALIVGGLLALNALVLLVVLLRRPAPLPGVTAAPAAAATAQAATAQAAAAAIAAVPASAVSKTAATAAPAASVASAAPTTASTAPAPVPVQAVAPLVSADLAGAAPARNPADYEPAVPPGSVATHPAVADYESLPSLSTLSEAPPLQLNMLDYVQGHPSEGYALINMHRVHEGDVLPEGARVLAIMRDGVAMEYHGQDFLLRSPGAPSQ